MCLGTFSRRGAVASATIYPCAELFLPFAAFQGKVLRNTLPFAIIRLYGQILLKYRLICQKTLPPLVTTAKERVLWRSNYRT